MKYTNNQDNGTITNQNNEIIQEYAIIKTGEEETLIKTKSGHITQIPTQQIPEDIIKDITTTPKKTTTTTKKTSKKKTTTKKQQPTKKEE